MEIREWGRRLENQVEGTFGVGPSKAISRGWDDFAKEIRFRLGDGGSIKFWLDVWLGDRTQKEEFLPFTR